MVGLRRYSARDEVTRAVLRRLSADLIPADDPHRSDEIGLADELIELAARNLTRAVQKSEPQSWPVGWGIGAPDPLNPQE